MALAATSSAILSAVTIARVGFVPAVIVAWPYAISHGLFASYLKAVRIERVATTAIGLLPEAAGVVNLGHSINVLRLSRTLGRAFQVTGGSLRDLDSAAILHDIGSLYASQPDVRESGFSRGDLARWGAEILDSSSRLGSASAIVAAQADPFRVPGRGADPELDVRSQIVQIACAADTAQSRGLSNAQVVEELYSESEYRLNPMVLAHLQAALGESDALVRPNESGND